MKRFLLLAFVPLLFLVGCVPTSRMYGPDIPGRLAASQVIVAERKQEAESLTIDQLAEIFGDEMPYYMLSQGRIVCDERVGARCYGEIELTSQYLAALAFEYAVTRSEETLAKIFSVLEGIREMDTVNGYDGYLARRVVRNAAGDLSIISNECHLNVITQLFFGYINVYEFVPEARDQVKEHALLIIRRLWEHDWQYVDNEGNDVPYSNCNPDKTLGFQTSAMVQAMSLVEMGIAWTDDPVFKLALIETRDRWWYQYGERMWFGGVSTDFLRIPTYSSTWLDVQDYYTLIRISENPSYVSAFKKFWRTFGHERNVFWDLIYLRCLPLDDAERAIPLRDIPYFLETFPRTRDNTEIINSPDKAIDVRPPIRVKSKWLRWAWDPLPIFQRPCDGPEWKDPPNRLDGNLGRDGSAKYSGVDFLEAYWFWEWLQIEFSLVS